MLEEPGLTALEIELFGVFSGQELHHIYPDGNEAYIIDIVFTCTNFTGVPQIQASEVLDLKWFDIDSLPENLNPPIKPALCKFANLYARQ